MMTDAKFGQTSYRSASWSGQPSAGVVVDAATGQPLEGVRVGSDEGAGGSWTESGRDGRWCLPQTSGAKLRVSKKGYGTKVVNGASGGPSRTCLLADAIVGYVGTLSVSPGDELDVRVHSPTAYRARLLRHGQVTELVADLGIQPPSVQTVPDEPFVASGLVWPTSFTVVVPASVRPGLYSLRLQPEAGEPFAITFVVRSDASRLARPRLLVLASTSTWQSYNAWGGRSRYVNFEAPPERTDTAVHRLVRRLLPARVRARIRRSLGIQAPVKLEEAPTAWWFRRLSIARPFPACSIVNDDPTEVFTSHLAPAEWRVLAWLEREGFAYDIVTAWDLHKQPELLGRYRAIMLNTHSEYWSRRMYDGLARFRRDGGWILNVSGNSVFREVAFDSDGSTRCVSLRFSESVADESALLGVRFTMAGYRTCAPYRVEQAGHWVFEGTGLGSGDTFAEQSLNHPEDGHGDGGSGHETDKMSATAPPGLVLLARGMNPDGGGADMVVDESDRGGVFSASSITFGGGATHRRGRQPDLAKRRRACDRNAGLSSIRTGPGSPRDERVDLGH